MAKHVRGRKEKPKTFWDKFWRDEHGKDVIWQSPNVFLITWFGTMVITWFMPFGYTKQALSFIGFVALVIWALLELFQGVNYFRRCLGLLVLIVTLFNRFIFK